MNYLYKTTLFTLPFLRRTESLTGFVRFKGGRYTKFQPGVRRYVEEWRRSANLPSQINVMGAFVDSVDYTFVDGRRTPVGSGRLKRAQKQQDLATKILTYTNEMDSAVEREQRLIREKEEVRQRILARKLKSKGLDLKHERLATTE